MLGSHSACAKAICIKNFKRHFSKAKIRITKDFETFIIFSVGDYNTLKVCFYLMLFHITTKVVGSATTHQCATQLYTTDIFKLSSRKWSEWYTTSLGLKSDRSHDYATNTFKLSSKSNQNDIQHHYVQYRMSHMTTQPTYSTSAHKTDQNNI